MIKGRHGQGLVRAAVAVGLLACAAPATAQGTINESAYVTGGVFVDVKRFSGDPSQGVLDGHAAGGALALGTFIGSRWDLQVGLDVTGFSTTERPNTVTFKRDSITLTSVTDNQVISVATLLRFRAAPHRRMRLGYLAGLSFVRLHRKFHTDAPEGTPAGLIPRPDARVDYSAAPTVGIDARIALNDHVSIVPGIYACVSRFADDSAVFVRPRVGVRWAF